MPQGKRPVVGAERLKEYNTQAQVLIVDGLAEYEVAQHELFKTLCVLTWEGDAGEIDWSGVGARDVFVVPVNSEASRARCTQVTHLLLGMGATVYQTDTSRLPLNTALADAVKLWAKDKSTVRDFIRAFSTPIHPIKPPEKPEVRRESAPPLAPQKKATAAEPFTAEALDSFSDEVRPQIVQGILESASVAVIAGAPNSGKTFLAIHLGVTVARGRDWFGAKCQAGSVLYVAAEAPGSVRTRARLAASQDTEGKRLPFYVVADTPCLGSFMDSVGDTQRLIATAKEVGSLEGLEVKLILIDTLAAVLADGEENAEGMIRLAGAASQLAQATGAAVVLLHHPSKADPAGLRGHSSLRAAVDTIVNVEVDELTGVRKALLVKSRDSAIGREVYFTLVPVTLPTLDFFGDPRTSCIVQGIDLPQGLRRRPKGIAREKLLTELERRYREGETGWDRAMVTKAGRSIGLHRNSALASLNGLLKDGFVTGSDAHLTLRYAPE